MKRYILALAFLPLAGYAQTPWDTNVIGITAPTQCSTGEPIASCPVTAYRVETAASSSGVFTTVTTIPATSTSYTQTGVSAGQHCYRMFSQSALGESVASNVVCRTNTKPVGPPNPPTLAAVDTAALVPVKRSWGYAMGDQIGVVKLGAECDSGQDFGNGFYALKDPKNDVTYYAGRRARKIVAAHCA